MGIDAQTDETWNVFLPKPPQLKEVKDVDVTDIFVRKNTVYSASNVGLLAAKSAFYLSEANPWAGPFAVDTRGVIYVSPNSRAPMHSSSTNPLGGRLYIIKNNQKTQLATESDITAIATDAQNNVYVATQDRLLVMNDTQTITLSLPDEDRSRTKFLTVDDQGRIYLATDRHEVYTIDLWDEKTIITKVFETASDIIRLRVDAKNIYVTTENSIFYTKKTGNLDNDLDQIVP